MLRLSIIERKESKHRITFLITLLLLGILVLLSIYDVIKENLIGIILVIIIVAFFTSIFTIKNYFQTGYVCLNKEEINIYSINNFAIQKFKISEIQRLRLIFTGIRGDISNSWLRGLAAAGIFGINEGINRIEIIDIDNRLFQYEIILDSVSMVEIIERESILISKINEGKVEILKELKI